MAQEVGCSVAWPVVTLTVAAGRDEPGLSIGIRMTFATFLFYFYIMNFTV